MNNRQVSDLDAAGLEASLQEIMRKIRSEVDPLELNNVRKIFKKSVPLFMRSYVAAYLLKYGNFRTSRKRPDTTVTLFVSIGKNRRVFPRDLVQLLIVSGKVQKNEIGDIKILDNYSFVEVEESKASEVITLMDGLNYRGRRIVVNFAKKREEREDSPALEEKSDWSEDSTFYEKDSEEEDQQS